MATTKRRRTRRRTANKTTTHGSTTTHKRRAATTSARRRKNPSSAMNRIHVRRHTTRRRAHRNPMGTGLLAKGFALAASAAGIQFLLGFVPPIGGMSAPADAARTGGLGWLLSMAMRKTGFLSRYADDVALAGLTLAGGKIISSVLVPLALRFFPQPAAQPAAQPAGTNGISMLYPSLNPYQAYAPGMGAIAVLDHSVNPYAAYAQ